MAGRERTRTSRSKSVAEEATVSSITRTCMVSGSSMLCRRSAERDLAKRVEVREAML